MIIKLSEGLFWFLYANLTNGLLTRINISVQFNTGNTLLAMKQDNDALSAFEDCLKIRQSKSPTHSYTAFVCHKLGSLLRSRADLTQAA